MIGWWWWWWCYRFGCSFRWSMSHDMIWKEIDSFFGYTMRNQFPSSPYFLEKLHKWIDSIKFWFVVWNTFNNSSCYTLSLRSMRRERERFCNWVYVLLLYPRSCTCIHDNVDGKRERAVYPCRVFVIFSTREVKQACRIRSAREASLWHGLCLLDVTESMNWSQSQAK